MRRDGVVELRGEVRNPAEKADLEARTRKIPEVRDVHNLLHLRKTAAPTRADSPGRAKRRTSATPKAKTPRTAGTGGRTTSAATRRTKPAQAEPAPADLAARRAGREPAPLGSSDPDAPLGG